MTDLEILLVGLLYFAPTNHPPGAPERLRYVLARHDLRRPLGFALYTEGRLYRGWRYVRD
jgi:hypothetical protein